MTDQPTAKPKCQNGHEQPVSGSKFCIYCGVAVVGLPPVVAAHAVVANQPPQPISPAPPNPQTPVGMHLQQAELRPQPPLATPAAPQFHGQYVGQPQARSVQQAMVCRTCGGAGAGLNDGKVMCPECRWLRPLVPGYQVDSSSFAWAADAKAMAALRAMTPLNAAAKAVSEKVGRRWIEVTFNGVRLSERQMPHIFGQAVRAARILGMSHMPDVYLSGERPWDMLTFGSDRDSFIVVGSAMAGNFQSVDMLFLLAREMGHCKAGHALWKTVIRFFLGEQGTAKGFMAGGIFNAILSPSALIGGAIEMPLLAWARQAEITADRAGLLTVGNEEIARRVLLSWSLKSSLIYRQINIESWLEQQAVDDGDMLRLSELTTSSTPYLGPRLKLLTQYAQSQELLGYLKIIGETIKAASPKTPKKTGNSDQVLRIKCSGCGTGMRIPMSVLAGKSELPVKCPDSECGTITRLKKNNKPATKASSVQRPRRMEDNLNYGD